MIEEEFYKHQQVLDAEIVNSMIIATPETWNEIELNVWADVNANISKFKHELSSPEGHNDVVSVIDDLMSSTYKLYEHYNSHKRPWSHIKFVAKLDGDGWQYNAEFKYDNVGL